MIKDHNLITVPTLPFLHCDIAGEPFTAINVSLGFKREKESSQADAVFVNWLC